MATSQQKTWNCFTCGKEVFFNKDVKRKDRPDKLQPLTIPYNQIPPNALIENYYHQCEKKKSSYDYEGKQEQQNQQQPQQQLQQQTLTATSASASASASKEKSNLIVVSKKDIDDIKNEVKAIREILEAAIKGNLFKPASEMTEKEFDSRIPDQLQLQGQYSNNNETIVGDEEDGEVIKNDDGEEVVT